MHRAPRGPVGTWKHVRGPYERGSGLPIANLFEESIADLVPTATSCGARGSCSARARGESNGRRGSSVGHGDGRGLRGAISRTSQDLFAGAGSLREETSLACAAPPAGGGEARASLLWHRGLADPPAGALKPPTKAQRRVSTEQGKTRRGPLRTANDPRKQPGAYHGHRERHPIPPSSRWRRPSRGLTDPDFLPKCPQGLAAA